MKVGNTVYVEDILTLVVGFLGFLVGMNILLMNQWDFGSRESMHLSALIELERLGDKVRFWNMDQRVGSGGGGDEKKNEGGGDATNKNSSNRNRNGRDKLFTESERKALGVVEDPNSKKMTLVVGSGKALKKVESEIQEKMVQAKKAGDNRSDVSR